MNYALAESVLAVMSAPEPRRAAAALERFTARDWQASAFWLDASGLALYFLDTLRRAGAENVLPAATLARLQQNAADNRRRSQAMLRDFAAVNEALTAAGIRFAALKGFTLAPRYCPDPALRLQLDLDYLVAAEQMAAITAAVAPLGYQPVSRLPFEVKFATCPGAARAHTDLYKPPINRTLEFHFRLFDRPELGVEPLDDALQRAQLRPCLGLMVPALAEEDVFLHQLFHAFQDVFLFSLRLSSLLEIGNALRAQRDAAEFWARVQARIEPAGARVAAMMGLVLALGETLFAMETPRALSAWTIEQCPPAIRLWVRHYGRRWALQPFPGNKLSLLVTRELMEERAWRAYARASLLPWRVPQKAGAERNSIRKIPARYWTQRALFHFREACRVGLAWPGWMWRRRSLRAG